MNFSLVSGGAAYMRLQAGEAKYSGTNTLIEYEIGKSRHVYLALCNEEYSDFCYLFII